jgi:hypothetical protein
MTLRPAGEFFLSGRLPITRIPFFSGDIVDWVALPGRDFRDLTILCNKVDPATRFTTGTDPGYILKILVLTSNIRWFLKKKVDK